MQKKYVNIQINLMDNKFNSRLCWVLALITILTLSLVYALKGFSLISVNSELSKIGADLFLKYLFVVVAVERAAAVFVGISHGQNKVDWSMRLNRISEVLLKESPNISVLKQVYTREHRLVKELESDGLIGAIDSIGQAPSNEDYLGYLTSAKHAYEFQRARFESVTNRYVSRIVFFAGIIMASLGLSLFNDLFGAMDLEISQAFLLRIADIFVTGGLLGGGSAGLNSIANKMTEYMNKS